jgi:hypothetical protein
MSFCPHHVYIPTGEDVAWYCPLCNPWYPEVPFDTRAVHLTRVLREGKDRANEGRWDGSGCPECGSAIYSVIAGNRVQCGECDCFFVHRQPMKKVLGLPVELSPEEQEALDADK